MRKQVRQRQIKRWLSRKGVLLVVLIFSMPLLGPGIYRFVKQTDRLGDEYAKHTQNIELNKEIAELGLYIKIAESANRGYVISRDRRYVENFDAVIDSIRAIYSKIRRPENRKEDGTDAELFLRSDSLVKEKIAFMQRVKSLCDNNDCNTAAALIASNEGLHLSDSITKINKQISDNIQTQIKRSQTGLLKEKRKKNNLAYTGIAASVFLIILVFYLLIAEIRRAKKISGELRVRKENYRITLNSLGEGLITTDTNGHVVYMNTSAEQLTGWNWREAKKLPLHKVFNVVNEKSGNTIEHIVSRILKDRKKIEWENNTILKSKNAGTFVISNTGSPLLDLNGNISGTVVVFNDISEKKRTENSLKEREKQYRDLIQNLPEAVYTCDDLGYIQLYNKAAVALWGREPVPGRDLWCGSWKIFNADGTDLPLDSCPMALCLKEGMPVHGKEIMIQQPDGNIRHVLTYPSPLFNSEGQLTGAINMLIDVTNKKEREILIQKTEAKYQKLIDQASDAILIVSFDGTIHEYNKSCYTLLGYSQQEYAKMKLTDILVDDIIVNSENYAALLAGESETLYRHLMRKDGSLIETEVTVKLLEDGKAIAIARDITERKKAERELAESENRLRTIVETEPECIKLLNSNCELEEMNPAGLAMIEADSLQQVKGRSVLGIIEKPYREAFEQLTKKVFEDTSGILEFEIKGLKGTSRWLETHAVPLKNGEGKIISLLSITRDITERKKAELAIKKEKELSESIISSLPGVFYFYDENLKLLRWNKQLENITGYSAAELSSMNPIEFFEGEDRLYMQQRSRKVFANGSGDAEANFTTKAGKKIPFYFTGLRMQYEGKPSLLGIGIDVTERKNAEKEIRDYKKALDESSLVDVSDSNGIIRYVNENFCKLSKYSSGELIGQSHRILNSDFHTDAEFRKLWNTLKAGNIWRNEMRNRAKDGSFFWTDTTIVPFLDHDGKPFQFIAIRTDITGRKNAETRMAEAVERYDILADATSDTIWDWNIINNTILYNDGITKMFGYNTSEVENVVDWWNEKLHADDFQKITDSLHDIFETKQEKFQLTYRFRCADGTYKNIFDRAFVIFEESGNPSRMIGAMQDITYQVQEEMRLSKAIINAHEEERRYIGEELHDNVNQILAGSLLALDMAKKTNSDSGKASEFIDMSRNYIGDAINEIRKLSHQLVPATSEENSLKDIFEDLLFSINLDNHFTINFHFDEFNEADIPDDVQINLYRILQEQVKNILKYSEASTIEVAVTIKDNKVTLRIFDNGNGFNTKTKKNGIGLSNIKKRAESLSGKFILNSAPNEGCEIIVDIPLAP